MRRLDPQSAEFRPFEMDYQNEGMAVIRSLDLPDSFDPPETDAVFLSVQDGGSLCEVYIGANTYYTGRSAPWREIQSQADQPGGTRLVCAVPGGFRAGAAGLAELLRQAGDSYACPGAPPARGPSSATQEPTSDGHATQRAEAPAHDCGGDGAPSRSLRDLVQVARDNPVLLVGREKELHEIKASLIRESKPGVVLLGAPGTGKTATVQMLAGEIATDRVPTGLRDTPVYELQLGSLLENARYIGDLERQVRELMNQPGRPIFFLDELHQLARQELRPLADLLKPALASGEIRVIGATTPTEWRQLQDRAFRRRFVEIQIGEPSPEETLEIMGPRVGALSQHHAVTFHGDTVREAIMLAERYLPHRSFPDKAIDLLDLASAMQVEAEDGGARLAATGHTGAVLVRPLRRSWLYQAVSTQSGLPLAFLDCEQNYALLEQAMASAREKLVGQGLVLEALHTAIRSRLVERASAWRSSVRHMRKSDDRRPVTTVIAMGPTGVGKSATARILADRLYGGRLVTLNASEVGPEAPHGVATWVGAPPGYVGYNQGGSLTDSLRQHKACLILVDEIEKASPEAVQNILLPLLGDGVVTDRNNGEALYATECVVFATSNIHLPRSDAAVGFRRRESENSAQAAHEALTQHLLPEVVARFNAVVEYRELTVADKLEIFWREVQAVEERLGVDVSVSRDVEERVARVASGARGVQEVIREVLSTCVAPRAKHRDNG